MNKIIVMMLGLFLSGSGVAETFYLHANIPSTSNVTDKALWFSDPVVGTDMATLGADFTGNQFDPNGKAFRQANASSATFDGTFVISAPVTNAFYSSDWNVYGMNINSMLQMRLYRDGGTLTVDNLALGASGSMVFRIQTYYSKNLSVGNISGSGSIVFGNFAGDTNGVWGLSITDTTPDFTGTVSLLYGKLTFNNSFSLADAALSIDAAGTNSVVLANNVTFGRLICGATTLTSGTYTASELNAALSTDRFSGPGLLSIPEPATIGMLGAGALATLLIRRSCRR
jgi:hypothetical protein